MNKFDEEVAKELDRKILDMLYQYPAKYYEAPNIIILGTNVLRKLRDYHTMKLDMGLSVLLTYDSERNLLIYGIPTLEDKFHPDLIKIGHVASEFVDKLHRHHN